MQVSSWQLLSVLCVLSCDCSASSGLRCVDPEQLVAGAAVTSTTGGDIVGTRYTYLDPRQNKTVTWTAYYVSTNPLAWYIHMSGFKGKGENKVVKFSSKNKNFILRRGLEKLAVCSLGIEPGSLNIHYPYPAQRANHCTMNPAQRSS